MPRANGGTNWGYIFAGSAVALTVIVNLLGWLTSGNEKLEKRVNTIEDALTWKYVSKELAAKDFGFIDRTLNDLKANKTDRDIYEQRSASIDRQMAILREHLKEIDRANTQTFNARDAFQTLQARMLELERATRK
jgi:hypothetical protein